MASINQVKIEYDGQASLYNTYNTHIAHGILEYQLIASALGDCAGLLVLDLGGGTGLRARQVLDGGAAGVDVVDLSPEMMRFGQEAEQSINRDGIRWFQADVSKPLCHLPMRTYDLVMANWVFDHAASVGELEGMWRNVVAYLKPGGRFVGIRVANPRGEVIRSMKHGVTYKDLEEISGGVRYRYMIQTDPPIEFEAASMDVSSSGSTEMHEKFGLEGVEVEPYENAQVVREDREFWRPFLGQPSFAVVKARKKMER